MAGSTYIGRFAPSPTGPLHFGSLVAAVASYADALAHGGAWHVRIDDIDPTREVAGASASIIDALRVHGFEFDTPTYQSDRLGHYAEQLQGLLHDDLAYRCVCTRKQLLATATTGRAGLIYPGTCAHRATAGVAVRLRCPDQAIEFTDALQGEQRCVLPEEIGDFLLWRGDNCVTYQLATALDDAETGCTHVVRGIDLLDSTFMQLAVQRVLGLPAPEYAHFPIITGADGKKLAKQSHAPPIDNKEPENNVLRALVHLKQKVPASLRTAKIDAIWRWSAENWERAPLTKVQAIEERSMIIPAK